VVSGWYADVRAAGDALTGQRKTFVIFNPASGRGRGAKRIAAYQALLAEKMPRAQWGTTTQPGQERDLADRALESGYELIVAAGGDGTWSNVADRVVASEREDVVFGVLPNGTGNDFGRGLGFAPADAAEAVRVLSEGHTRSVDVGRLDTTSASEHRPELFEPRHFINLIGFGFDIAVIDAAARARFLKGELLYKVTALQQLFRFQGVRFGIETSAGSRQDALHLMLTVSNGRYFGGGFPIAPEARIDDGLLHACLIADAPPMGRLKLFNLAERGRHVLDPRVEIISDTEMHLTFPDPPRFEVDGDVRNAADSSLQVRLLPGALQVVTPRVSA
jgi:diacylglycerol kinase (ATP)